MLKLKTDSRKIKPGDTFVALKGISSNGHDYIEQAIENGATEIIAEYGNYRVKTLIVADSRKYLEDYLKVHYSYIINELDIIGVTGTNGKTTTCYLLYQALNELGIKTAYCGTLGYYLDSFVKTLPNTTPDILEMYEMLIEIYSKGYRSVIMEVSSHGISNRRIEGIKFDQVIFTNLTQDHLDFHLTMENYVLTKQELFKRVKDKSFSIVNADDKYHNYFLINKNTSTFGINNGDFRIEKIDGQENGTNFNFEHKGITYNVKSRLLGEYNVYNLMGVIIALFNKVNNMDIIINVIPKLKSPKGRLDIIQVNEGNVVIDYAHTPDAIEKVITTISKITSGNIYTIFGCTGDREREKRPLMTEIVTKFSKWAIITNDDPHYEDPNQIVSDMTNGIKNDNYEVILDREKAILKGISYLEKSDFLLILGKGHEEYMVIKDKMIPCSDHKIVNNYINNKEV